MKTGEPPSGRDAGHWAAFQSTPVSEDGRTPYLRKHLDDLGFQSTPVSEDGRTVLAGAAPLGKKGFNPRPSVKTGEHHFFWTCLSDRLFQSTPVSEDGRTHWQAVGQLRRCLFQSTPVSEDGRTTDGEKYQAKILVSIHARQ